MILKHYAVTFNKDRVMKVLSSVLDYFIQQCRFM